MATLVLTGPADALGPLPTDPTVDVNVVIATAKANADGTWTVTAHAPEDQISGLEARGLTVQVVQSDDALLAVWQEIAVDDTGIA